MWLPAEDVPRYCADPAGYLAKHYRITRAEYLAWHDTGYNVQCATIRENGKRCRNIVDNGHAVGSPNDWAYLQGSICHVHADL
ncbi:hypothetical protein R5M92_04200 [Halomonas sp. Bachu 37]|uniref:hypothetical protein n=1 Tax=Halomonas kashgarensis TaxID=3084920 RepID=UPI00321670AF